VHLWPESCANAIGNSNSSRRCLRLPKVQPENFPIQCARTEFHCPNGPRLDSRYWKSSVQHQPKFSQFDGNRRQWVISSMKTLRNNQWFESCLWLFFNTSVTNWPNDKLAKQWLRFGVPIRSLSEHLNWYPDCSILSTMFECNS